jgi:phosphatidylserine/phosphatidylglycerophosphate/cardiolipin synthase-like enzyme
MPITAARAWCNNEVAYLAWSIQERTDGLLGFMIVRAEEDATGTVINRRLLPSWVAFKGQSNPNWLPQDTSVWPVQKFEWRDLTLRRSRDQIAMRSAFACHYEIWPVGAAAPGRTAVIDWRAANPAIFTSANPANMTGAPLPLFLCEETPFLTNSIKATTLFGDFEAVFTNGILSTQNLRVQLHTPAGQAPSAQALRTQHTKVVGDPIREFLSGDVLPTLKQFLADIGPGEEAFGALYELTDPELVPLLEGLGARLHLILSTAGSPTKTDPAWDSENHDARVALHATAGEMIDRLFNNSGRIGHNKFMVHVDANGQAKRVLTGSTNWTDTGLCTQSNNSIIATSASLAGHYLDYWHALADDTATFPAQADTSVPNRNVQGQPLRTIDAQPYPADDLAAGVVARQWRSPNTVAVSKTDTSPPPADLTDVFALMRAAKQAILFLTFMPSPEGAKSVIDMAVELGKENPELLVQGAISSPLAMPNYVAAPKGGPKLPTPSVFSPEGAPKVLTIRAAAIDAHYGDFEPELLSAGFAIIHDKIVVIDPFSPDCVVITGSHNLGFKASYANDDNLIIVQGNQPLAEAYAIHVLDVFEHYRFRAVLEQRERDRIAAGGPAEDPNAAQEGFLASDDSWQDATLSSDADPGLRRFLPLPPPAAAVQ